jgi:hypothetical protein
LKRPGRSSAAFRTLSVTGSIDKSEGIATLVESENRFGFFVSPVVSPGCVKMSALLMT